MTRDRRKGFVIVAVLIAGISGLWVATSLLFLMQSDVRAAEVTMARTQHRSLGLSGLRLLADVLVEQRDVLLAGGTPMVEDQYSLWDEGDREAVVRLLPNGPGGGRLTAEAGRLDLNHATVEMLTELPMLTAGQAEAIVAARDARPSRRFSSIYELLAVEGIEVADVFGDLAEERSMDQALGEEGDLAERVEARLLGVTPRGLSDVLTVYGFEPNLQQSGKRRIDLNVPWSDELAQRLTERFGEGAARALEQIFKETSFAEDAEIVRVLRTFNVPPKDWAEPLDALTTIPDVHVGGRLDLNTASAEALEALPGIDQSMADRLVAERDSLDESERATIVWPLTRDILTVEDYELLAGLVTVRSWTWRVRIAAGTVAADDPDGPIEHAVVYEAVIDLADPRPRLGYLREITMLQTASTLAAALELEAESSMAAAALDEGSPERGDDLEIFEPLDPDIETDLEPGFDRQADVEDLVDPRGGDEDEPDPDPATGTRRVGRWIP